MTDLQKLLNEGYIENPYFWISNGYFYCKHYKEYRYHHVMSNGQGDDKILCKTCGMENK